MFGQDPKPSRSDLRLQHLAEDRMSDAGFVAKPGDPTIAGIQSVGAARGVGERRLSAVVIANRFAERAIISRATEVLDPRVLIRRDALRGELASDPVGRFGQHHAKSLSTGRQRSRAATHAGSHDYQIAGDLALGRAHPRRTPGNRR